MPKKSSSNKRQGIRVGVRKHRISSDTDTRPLKENALEGGMVKTPNILVCLGLDNSRIESLAAIVSSSIFHIGHPLRLFPIFKTENGKYVVKTGLSRCSHVVVLGLGLLIFIEKVLACLSMLHSKNFKAVHIILGVSVLSVHFCGWLFAASVILHPKETADVLNSWLPLQEILTRETGRKMTQFSDLSASVKCVAVTVITILIAFNVGIASVLLRPMPTFWVYFVADLGLFPKSNMNFLPIKMLFFPAEMFVSLSLMTSAAFSLGILVLGIGLHNLFAVTIRLDQYFTKSNNCI